MLLRDYYSRLTPLPELHAGDPTGADPFLPNILRLRRVKFNRSDQPSLYHHRRLLRSSSSRAGRVNFLEAPCAALPPTSQASQPPPPAPSQGVQVGFLGESARGSAVRGGAPILCAFLPQSPASSSRAGWAGSSRPARWKGLHPQASGRVCMPSTAAPQTERARAWWPWKFERATRKRLVGSGGRTTGKLIFLMN